jgi:hypothetical protein
MNLALEALEQSRDLGKVTMSRRPLSRRTLLRGASQIAIALPFLEEMTAHAQTTTFPKRFVGLANFDGSVVSAWRPSGTETAFSFSATEGGPGYILKPLEPYKSKLLVLDGLDNEVSYHGPAPGGHDGGTIALLSGSYAQAGNIFCGGGGCTGWGNGITIDQRIGATVGRTDRFKALTLGVRPEDKPVMSYISYTGPAAPVPSIRSPVDVFNKLFTNFTAPGGTTTPPPTTGIWTQRRSVLDSAIESIDRLKVRLGAADRMKLDQYLTSIRQVEVELTAPPEQPPSSVAGCSKPAAPAAAVWDDSKNVPLTSKLMIDLLVLALACQMTRSVTLQFGRSVGSMNYSTFIPGVPNDGQHSISHYSATLYGQAYTKINHWYAEQMAYLLSKMSAITEGTGTLLDHSVVFWGNSLSYGPQHERRGVPFVLAGGAGGYFRTGRYLKFGGRSHSDLLVSLLNAVGVADTRIGEPEYCNGPLPGLV